MTNQTFEVARNSIFIAGKNVGFNAQMTIQALLAFTTNEDGTRSFPEFEIERLKGDFIEGVVCGSTGLTRDVASDYLPDCHAKPGMVGKWKPFMWTKGFKFDAAVHRPEGVQRAYNSAMTQWSLARDKAGLPKLKATRAPNSGQGKPTRAGKAAEGTPAHIDQMAVPHGLTSATFAAWVADLDKLATHIAKGNAATLGAEALKVATKLASDIHAYAIDARKAFVGDSDGEGAVAESEAVAKLKAELAASRKANDDKAAALNKAREAMAQMMAAAA